MGGRSGVILQFLIVSFVAIDLASGSIYVKQCPLSDSITLTFDPESGEFDVVDTKIGDGEEWTGPFPEARTTTFQAKICPCAPTGTFCLLDNPIADTCGVPGDPKAPIGCFSLSTRTLFIRNAWPVVVLWYGALAIFLLVTDNGRNARNYVLARCFPGRNQRIADRIVRREVEIRDRLRAARIESIRRARNRLRRALANFRGEDPDSEDEFESEMVLKTRVYDTAKERMRRKKARADNSSLVVDTSPDSDVEEGGVPTPDTLLSPASSSSATIGGSTAALSMTDSASTNFDSPSPNDIGSSAELIARAQDEEEEEDDADGIDLDAVPDQLYNEEEDTTCIICMAPVVDGDKIGVLQCNHLFHSDCLKQWIRRRNVCPLCQEPDIASWRRARREQGSAMNDDGDRDNGDSDDSSSSSEENVFNSAARRSRRRMRQRAGLRRNEDDQSLESLRSSFFYVGRIGEGIPPTERSRARRIISASLASSPSSNARRRSSNSSSSFNSTPRQTRSSELTLILTGSQDDAVHRRRYRIERDNR